MRAKQATVALVGSETLLGREIRDVATTSEAGFGLRLIAADEERPGVLTSVGDEAALTGALDPNSFSGVSAVFLTGSAASSSRALELAGEEPGVAVIDLTFGAEDRPDARLRAPQVEGGEAESGREAAQVVAHPAAIALALFLRRLHAHHPIRRSVILALAPASEQGPAGLEELQQQTTHLLSFKSLPQQVFDAQIAFNLLPKYGEEAPVALEETELRIERHLATLLGLPGDGRNAPMPSLRVIQAPVFHGYSFSAWVEFEENPGVESLENSLAAEGIEVRGFETEPPTNVGQAGSGGIAIGGIGPDRNNAQACWFWIVADNFRVTAENAVAVAKQIL
jgi:aspartate-semialdehyde dehydrogenase